MAACPALLNATHLRTPTVGRSRSPSAKCARWAYAASLSIAIAGTTSRLTPIAGLTMFDYPMLSCASSAARAATAGPRSGRILGAASRRNSPTEAGLQAHGKDGRQAQGRYCPRQHMKHPRLHPRLHRCLLQGSCIGIRRTSCDRSMSLENHPMLRKTEPRLLRAPY